MRNLLVVLILLLTAILGCSSSSEKSVSPTMPTSGITGNLPIGVSDRFPDGSPSEGFGVMGLFELTIDALNMRAELTPIRKSALTDVLEVVDITNFLMMAPCTTCVKIKSVAMDADGHLVVSIGIRHPFPTGDPFKPITGKNRADLHVFNIEGILASQGTSTAGFPNLGMIIDTPKLINASGYTSYLDAVLDADVFTTDANAHPYILHFADYSAGNYDPSNPTGFASVTDPPPSGNLVMAMGCDYDYRDYVFDLTSGDMTYTYAVGCTYAISSPSKSKRFAPEYRIPQHLKKAASEIHVLLSGTLKQMQPTETITLSIQVVDPSHGVAVGTDLNQMLADSSVGSVKIEIPGILASSMSQPGSAAISGTGHDPSNPLLYEFTISNEQSASIGTYQGLAKVTDTYTPGLNTVPSLNGKDGIKRVPPGTIPTSGTFDISEFATYAAFPIEVELGYVGQDPVAKITRTKTGCPPVDVTFDASDSTDEDDDPLGIPLHFEFDFDYDGTNFTVDWPSSTNPVANHMYNTEGCYIAAVRVTDSDNNQDIATVIVPIGHFTPGSAESDVTDGATITDIDYTHGGLTFVPDIGWPGTSYPMKGTARGNGYIYTTYYGVQGGTRSIFFSRSDDDGATWETPVVMHSYDATGEYGGCSIVADNTGQVIVVWVDRVHNDVVIEYSTDSGDTFNESVIRNGTDCFTFCKQYRTPDVAIDPTNPDNIIVSVMYLDYYSGGSWSAGGDNMYINYSSTGPGGTFNEVFWVQPTEWRPGWVQNIYKIHAHYAIDGDGYIIATENNNIHVFRSPDHGATWSITDPALHMINTINPWHRHYDTAMDPTDPNVFYVTGMRHTSPFSIELYKSTDGLTVTQIQTQINDSATSYQKLCPSVTVNDAGVVYVMWHTNQSGNFDIMADFSCNGGVSFGADVQFNTVNNGNEVDPDLTPNACGDGVVCIWEQRGDTSGGKLVARNG